MKLEEITEKDLKFIVYKDDDDLRKEKYCVILEKDETGIKIQICDIKILKHVSSPFFLPWIRVLKIKDINVKK